MKKYILFGRYVDRSDGRNLQISGKGTGTFWD